VADDEKTGSAVGSGSAAAGSGSAAGTPAPVPPPAPVVIEPSKDQLPAMADVAKAKVTRFGPAPRGETLQGIGKSKDVVTALFEELKPGDLAPHPYEAEGGAYAVVQLVARSQPQVTEFEKDADERVAELREKR